MSLIDIEITGPIGWIMLNSPAKMNALNQEMWAKLPSVIEGLDGSSDVRVIVIRGVGGKAFSAGADISEFDKKRSGDGAAHYNELNSAAFAALQNTVKPTIAMIDGFCIGGGFLLALSTDLRVASTGASFSLPPAKLGLGFDVNWISLVLKALPAHFAKEMFFTAKRYSAKEIAVHGMINKIVPDAKILAETTALANHIAANAPLTLRNVKATINELLINDQSVDFAVQQELMAACFDSDDYIEGQLAFKEKRKPIFSGK